MLDGQDCLGKIKIFIQQRCDGADDDGDVDGWILILVEKKSAIFYVVLSDLSVCITFRGQIITEV